ncbi:gp53 [Bacillus phage W.Ph.]|uniref:Gp53 n=1 Tax=Bacillus phage W.Ph. TaxID=764595 RepID=G9B1F4_9CAUD|nr:gp53 [Bacillus phage W.Ph.]ADH03199.1 gp53 [Bacillus phage W.Ph.]
MYKYKIIQLLENINATVDHGECFYDEQELLELISDMDRLKNMSKCLYEQNKEEE